MEFFSLLAGTVWLRPYVFIFLAMFLFLASRQIGWARTLFWTVTGYGLALAAEYGSIHWGFPFGKYHYLEATRGRELWVAGVPFMDSLSFTFLSYVGYSCAWQLAAARQGARGPLTGAGYRAVRGSGRVLVLGAAITTLMDLVIDPVTLLGDRWFLGLIYGYAHTGRYFGVPLSNFGGWLLLSAAIIGVNQWADARLPGPAGGRGPAAVNGGRRARPPYLHLGGFVLFLCVTGFMLAVTAWLGEVRLFLASAALVLLFLLVSWRVLYRGGLLRPAVP